MAEQEKVLPLGRRLRQVTNEAQSAAEIKKFEEILFKYAQQGLDRVQFNDLREYLPNLIATERIRPWMEQNELQMIGQINQETAQWQFTIVW